MIGRDTTDEARGIYDELYKGAADNDAITGLGDAAYWSKTFDLEVLVGRYVVGVYVDHLVADRENVEKAIATKVLARLP